MAASAFFGVQLALDLPAGDDRRQVLAQVVREHREATGLPAQRILWTRAATALRQSLPTAQLGTWDLIRDDASSEYEDWASGLEAMARWPMEDFGSQGGYLLASLIVLVQGGSNADRTLGDVCDLPERVWYERATYGKLIDAMPMLNFTNVLGSGLYLAPRPDHPGFALDVLQGEGFEYLMRVSD